MARGRAGFLKAQSMSDEALKLQREQKKAGMFGSIGSLLGSIALTPFLGPGASILMKSLVPAVGSYVGNIAARKIGGADIDKGGLWFKGQKEQAASGLDTSALTGALTTGLTAGITPWLKGGMKDPLTGGGLDIAGAKEARHLAKMDKLLTKDPMNLTKMQERKINKLFESDSTKWSPETSKRLLDYDPQRWGEASKMNIKKASDYMRDSSYGITDSYIEKIDAPTYDPAIHGAINDPVDVGYGQTYGSSIIKDFPPINKPADPTMGPTEFEQDLSGVNTYNSNVNSIFDEFERNEKLF